MSIYDWNHPDDWPGKITSAAGLAYFLWKLWNDSRKHRKKLASRVTGLVKDLGHKLTVVNVPSHG